MLEPIGRRDFLAVAAGGILEMGRSVSAQAVSAPGATIPRIFAITAFGRGIFYFNPAGLYVAVGQKVQWMGVGRSGFVTEASSSVTAFHPSFDNHELRIPEGAKPFNSRTMPSDGGIFEWTFDEEGTYDFYGRGGESLGMVGRIVVGKPGGPGEKPPGYGNREGRSVMYPDAARVLEYLKSDEIVKKKSVPYPIDLMTRRFPWR